MKLIPVTETPTLEKFTNSEPDQCANATKYFLRKQEEMKSLPQAQAAGKAYRIAEAATEDVKGHIERLRLAVGFPLGSVCDGCWESVNPVGKGNPLGS